MIEVAGRACLKLVSSPYSRRAGLFPFAICIATGWTFVILWLAVAACAFWKNSPWGLLLLTSLAAFSVFLSFATYSVIRDSYCDYILEINETEAVLVTIDRWKKSRSTKMVLLDDVKFVEYYPYRDSAAIVFHSPYIQMEVPLWPMGQHGHDVVDFLEGRGVRVIDVQSDEDFPT